MSNWSYIRGTVLVSVPGRTDAEIEYIIRTVLEHMPRVMGSERDMEVHYVKLNSYSGSLSCDEYGMHTNNLKDVFYDTKSKHGCLKTHSYYSIVLNGALRDVGISNANKQLCNFLCRLAKRLDVSSIVIKVTECYTDRVILYTNSKPFSDMYEYPSWSNEKTDDGRRSVAWWEHLMWDPYKDEWQPINHLYKYFRDPEVDKEMQKKFDNYD